MTVELDESPIVFPDDPKTLDFARVRIKGGTTGWQTAVEINGVGIPCTALTYEVSAGGVPALTLTFPAIIELDAAMERGQIVLKQPLVSPDSYQGDTKHD